MNSLILYIDPGTGSMLFSVVIGAAATVFFLAKAAILKLKVFFSGKRNGVLHDAAYKPYVIYCEGKQYWNVFKPVIDAFKERGLPLTYLTSAKDDPIFEEPHELVQAEYIGEGNAAFARLNIISAGVVVMSTPGLNVYQLKRSRSAAYYANLLHGASDATMMKMFGLDFFDAILLTGNYQAKDIRYLEQLRGIPKKDLPTVGCTYLDNLAKKMQSIPAEEDHPFTVLVSPSWGPSSLLCKYGKSLLEPLAKSGWRVIVRPHPQSKKAEPDVLSKLEAMFAAQKNIKWDYSRDNIDSMKKADVMISDFSAIIYDYTFLCDKPVLYVNAELDLRPYDAWFLPNHGKDIWQFRVLRELGQELHADQFGNIMEIIRSVSDSQELRELRQKAKNEAWMHQGHAGENVADFMIATLERITKGAEDEQKPA